MTDPMTKPMTMVERVARAMLREQFSHEGRGEEMLTALLDDAWASSMRERAIASARAAIAAMREPTEAMIKAGVEAHAEADDSGIDDKPWMPETLPPTYRAMIDAALTDPK